MAQKAFPAIYLRDKEAADDAPVGVVFQDFPGCVTSGVNLADAIVRSTAALQSHINALRADGVDLPEASSSDSNPAWDDLSESDVVFRQYVVVNVAEEDDTVRVNVTLPQSLLDDIARVSKNRSRFLADAAREKLNEEART